MLRPALVLALAAAAASPLHPVPAQGLGDVPTMWDLAVGVGNLTTVSVAASRATYAGTNDRFRAGFGVRGTLVAGNARLGPSDADVIGPSPNDTLAVSSGAMLINVGVNLGFEFSARWRVGLNLDVFGMSLGSSQAATYHPSPGAATQTVSTKPSSPNIFAGGSGDKGSLNSEFFAAYTLSERYTLRGGLSHQLVEYKVDTPLESNTRRFRRYDNLVFVGIRMTRARP